MSDETEIIKRVKAITQAQRCPCGWRVPEWVTCNLRYVGSGTFDVKGSRFRIRCPICSMEYDLFIKDGAKVEHEKE